MHFYERPCSHHPISNLDLDHPCECARRAAQSPAEETLVEGRFGFFLILSRTTIRILKDTGSDDHLLDVLAHQSAG
ncbi:unnamed protein product [Jaminaea pallidilutea]